MNLFSAVPVLCVCFGLCQCNAFLVYVVTTGLPHPSHFHFAHCRLFFSLWDLGFDFGGSLTGYRNNKRDLPISFTLKIGGGGLQEGRQGMRKELKCLEARGGSGWPPKCPCPGLLSWPPPSSPWLFTQYVLLSTCVKHLLLMIAKGPGAVGDSISCLGIVSSETSDSSLHQDGVVLRAKKKEEGINKAWCFREVVQCRATSLCPAASPPPPQPPFQDVRDWRIAPSCCGKVWGIWVKMFLGVFSHLDLVSTFLLCVFHSINICLEPQALCSSSP